MGAAALLMGFGLMAEATVGTAPDGHFGGSPTIAVVWGIGVTVACLMFARACGVHMNPAVTLPLALIGRFPWRKTPYYVGAQLLGSLVASFLVRILTVPLINRFDPGLTIRSQAVFSTLPGDGVPQAWAFANELLATFVLVVVLLALLDHAESSKLMAKLEPFAIGGVVTGIGLFMCSLSGWAINPARDLPPRLMQWLTGYSTAWVDQTGTPYWWIPIIGPLLGGALGALAYKVPGWYRALDQIPQSRSRVTPQGAEMAITNGGGSSPVSRVTPIWPPTTAAYQHPHPPAPSGVVSRRNGSPGPHFAGINGRWRSRNIDGDTDGRKKPETPALPWPMGTPYAKDLGSLIPQELWDRPDVLAVMAKVHQAGFTARDRVDPDPGAQRPSGNGLRAATHQSPAGHESPVGSASPLPSPPPSGATTADRPGEVTHQSPAGHQSPVGSASPLPSPPPSGAPTADRPAAPDEETTMTGDPFSVQGKR